MLKEEDRSDKKEFNAEEVNDLMIQNRDADFSIDNDKELK